MKSNPPQRECCEDCAPSEIENEDGSYTPMPKMACIMSWCKCHTPQQESYKLQAKPIGNVTFNGIEYTPVPKPLDASWESPSYLQKEFGVDYVAASRLVAFIRKVRDEAWKEAWNDYLRHGYAKDFEAGILEGRRRAVGYIKEHTPLFVTRNGSVYNPVTGENTPEPDAAFWSPITEVLEAASQESTL